MRKVIVVLTSVGALLLTAYFLWAFLFLSSWTERGAFGDTFGALGAVISAAGFVLVAYTLHLQQSELQLLVEQYQKAEKRRSYEKLPRFKLQNAPYEDGRLELQVINGGARIEDVSISGFHESIPGFVGCGAVTLIESPSLIQRDDAVRFLVQYKLPPPPQALSVSFVLDFLDIDYDRRRLRVFFEPPNRLWTEPLGSLALNA